MKKLVNGELVDLTQAEITARNAEQAASNVQAIEDHISIYGKQFETAKLIVGGFGEDFTQDNRRNLKEAVDLLREKNAPLTTTVKWNSPNIGYGVKDVSLQTMIDWLVAGGEKRQARFNIEPLLRANHATTPYTSIDAIETAFDNAYND